jgi:TRAP-type C4-dicarboxylate transport system permease small subunit
MLKKLEEVVVVFCIVAIMVIMNVNIVLRHVFNMSWSPTEEVCLVMVVIFTFIGSAYAARIGAHLFASFLFDIPFISYRFKKLLAVTIALITGIAALYVAYLGIDFVRLTYNSARSTAVLGIPFYTFYVTLPVGFALIAWESFKCLIKNIRSKGKYYLGSDCGTEDK